MSSEWKSQLDAMQNLLYTELQHERLDVEQLSVTSQREIERLKGLLDKERSNSVASTRLIEKLTKENEKLNTHVRELEISISQQSKQAMITHPASSKELDIEKRKRIKAEQELDIFRRQSRTLDEQSSANARRVAVVLAQRCAELYEELERMRTSSTNQPQLPVADIPLRKEVTSAVTTPQVQAVKTGWGLDDDDLFSGLT